MPKYTLAIVALLAGVEALHQGKDLQLSSNQEPEAAPEDPPALADAGEEPAGAEEAAAPETDENTPVDPAVPPEPEGCVDDAGYEDDYGDGCEWYDNNPDGCGYYDDDGDEDALVACCACQVDCSDALPMPVGEDENGECIDNDLYADDWDDACDWYTDNPDGCGEYDNPAVSCGKDSMVSCCACQTGDAT